MKTRTPFYAQMEGKCGLAIIPNEQTDMGLRVNSKCTNVRTVRIAHSAICAQKQKKATIKESTEMKSGNPKKNMYVRSFQTRKLVKFTESVKSMSNQRSGF